MPRVRSSEGNRGVHFSLLDVVRFMCDNQNIVKWF